MVKINWPVLIGGGVLVAGALYLSSGQGEQIPTQLGGSSSPASGGLLFPGPGPEILNTEPVPSYNFGDLFGEPSYIESSGGNTSNPSTKKGSSNSGGTAYIDGQEANIIRGGGSWVLSGSGGSGYTADGVITGGGGGGGSPTKKDQVVSRMPRGEIVFGGYSPAPVQGGFQSSIYNTKKNQSLTSTPTGQSSFGTVNHSGLSGSQNTAFNTALSFATGGLFG